MATSTPTDDNAGPKAGHPPAATAERSKLWFDETVVVPDAFRDLLVNYSGIPAADVDEHVIQIRNKAWEVHHYPCLGQFRFLELNLSSRPRGDLYERLLSTLKGSSASSLSSSPAFLDVGACLGQDVRKLIHDGAPPGSVAGAELSPTFIRLGYELFRDSPAHVAMVQADILEPLVRVGEEVEEGSAASLVQFRGKLSVVQLGMILHLFTWEEQLIAFENAVALLRDEPGVLIIGQATGNLDGVVTQTLSVGGANRGTCKHNVESFKRLVKYVEARTGTQWDVKAELDEALSVNDGKRTWDDPKTRRLLFEMERVG
ncbi:methyltransferase [Diaporthe helianthi]|uniref:Methyltransferase n=1 Tax=Diaporthe helianthi TaxID=158607 RepID=A0A2P5I1Y0_DIAHE|nr:methyltransferase [Diaporthe helianthi]